MIARTQSELFASISLASQTLKNNLEQTEFKAIPNEEYISLYNEIANFAENGPSKNQENLHEKQLFLCFNEQIATFFTGIKEKLENKAGILYLEEFVNCSRNYCYYAGYLVKFFRYLDQFHLKKKSTDLSKESFSMFKSQFLKTIQFDVFNEVFGLLDNEREGYDAKKTLILKVIQFYFLMCYDKNIRLEYDKELKQFFYSGINENHDYQFYRENFEEKLKENVKAFYYNKINSKWLTEGSSAFLHQALAAFKREEDMAISYYPISKEIIKELLKKLIIEEYYNVVLDNGLMQMLINSSYEDLENCYRLYAQVEYILKEKIAKIVKEYVEFKAGKITTIPVKELKNSQEITHCFEEFITLKKDIEGKLEKFGNFIDIERGVDSAFYSFFVTDESARFLAIFFDNFLRKIQNNKTDQESDLQYLIKLFKYLSSRDEFFETYKKKLIARILDETIKSFDYEKDCLSKLKKECGVLSTITNCESILQHTEGSKIITANFKEKLKEYIVKINENKGKINENKGNINENKGKINENKGNSHEYIFIGNSNANIKGNINEKLMDFEFKILEKSSYNTSKKPQNFELIYELQPIIKGFQQYYKEINQNRLIEFMFQDGISELFFITNKKYRLKIFNDSLPIFMLFNNKTSIEKGEIEAKTGLSAKILEDRLNVCEKLKILTKNSDIYTVNQGFQSEKSIYDLYRIKPSYEGKIMMEIEEIKGEDEVKIKRECILDATIVRVMKFHITRSYNELMGDCTKLVQNVFKPELTMIRKRIESLMERGYMGRDANDSKILKYIA